MSQEIIALLEKAKNAPLSRNAFIEEALTLLKKKSQAGEFTKKARLAAYDKLPKQRATFSSLSNIILEACDIIDRAEAINAELVTELEECLKAMDGPAVQCEGDWQTGMFCGLEDKNITDRYEACMYGYEKALERVKEWALCGFEAALAKAQKE